ncbi:MAG: class I SAM-dependent methyltransferase [Patescibacteria group bacterium]
MNHLKSFKNITPGYGLLEKLLSKKRMATANMLIGQTTANRGKILDIGCGITPLFLMNTHFQEKFGIDPSVDTSFQTQNLTLIKFDVENESTLPFDNSSFDAVTMLAVFEHIEQHRLPQALREIYRVLKPGGVFILTTPCPWADKLLRCLAFFNIVSREGMNEHKGAYDHGDLAKYLSQGGFDRKKMKFGYFELFLNSWATAQT